jgi:metal-sulfur cluster biosynthetic enzyme
MFRAVPLPIRSPLTVHLALVYGIRFRRQLSSPARKLTSNRMTYTSAKCTVNGLLMMGRGTARNM